MAAGKDSITAAGLGRLLARLDADGTQAEVKYEKLRRALVKFFDWRGVSEAEECADEALDRLSRKLGDTAVDNIWNYARGIASMVLRERRRVPILLPLDEVRHHAATSGIPPDEERVHECLERCLAAIPAESRSLILRYYEDDGQGRIANRRRLATTLGLSDNALRCRVQRLRDGIEQCIRACVSEAA